MLLQILQDAWLLNDHSSSLWWATSVEHHMIPFFLMSMRKQQHICRVQQRCLFALKTEWERVLWKTTIIGMWCVSIWGPILAARSSQCYASVWIKTKSKGGLWKEQRRWTGWSGWKGLFVFRGCSLVWYEYLHFLKLFCNDYNCNYNLIFVWWYISYKNHTCLSNVKLLIVLNSVF